MVKNMIYRIRLDGSNELLASGNDFENLFEHISRLYDLDYYGEAYDKLAKGGALRVRADVVLVNAQFY